jgi:hypothetical protein
MISSLTSLERTGPLSIGIATFNAILIAGVVMIANNHQVTMQSPKNIQMEVLSAGFDLAFLLSLLLGIVILILTFALKAEVHPDYAADPALPVKCLE